MSISVVCEHCGWKADVKDASAGKKGKCPTCGEPVVVPHATSEEVDVEAAAAAALLEGDDGPAPLPPPSYVPSSTRATGYVPHDGPGGPKPVAKSPSAHASKFEYRPKEKVRERRGITISGGVIVAALMMGGAALWFLVGMAAGRIYIYPPILFILGFINLVRSLLGKED